MRRVRPMPKDRRKVSIPDDLRESFRQVHELILEAKRDPDIRLDHGDAIQVGAVCGGRYGKKPRRYVFTYFPQGDSERGKWYLTLDHTEIEDIGDGRMTEITMSCCTSSDCQTKFREADGRCFYCDYFDDPDFGSFEFPLAEEKLIQRGVIGLCRTSTKEEVTALLGTPDKIGGGITIEIIGYVPPWINYRLLDCQVTFRFDEADTLGSITVLERDWEPGK